MKGQKSQLAVGEDRAGRNRELSGASGAFEFGSAHNGYLMQAPPVPALRNPRHAAGHRQPATSIPFRQRQHWLRPGGRQIKSLYTLRSSFFLKLGCSTSFGAGDSSGSEWSATGESMDRKRSRSMPARNASSLAVRACCSAS